MIDEVVSESMDLLLGLASDLAEEVPRLDLGRRAERSGRVRLR